MNNFPLRRQQLGDNGCGGSLSVGAGHGQNRAGADLKKRLHFRGDDAAPCHGGGQLRHIRPQARGAEDDILVNVLQIILPQLQLAALRGQFCAQLAQTLLFIPGGHGHALFQQLFDEGPVRYADADDTHRFPPQRGQICFKIHITLLIYCSFYIFNSLCQAEACNQDGSCCSHIQSHNVCLCAGRLHYR